MPLILAVEPNNSQAQQLTSLVRQYLKAELITAPSAHAALQALGNRIPDLILTPALLAPKDESALTERLRELGNAAGHVQTLAVPILASGKSKPAAGGILGRKREKEPSDPVGCHPSVFAEQIQIYLERAASERGAVTGGATSTDGATGAPLITSDPGTAQDEGASDDDTLDVIFDTPVEPLLPPPPATPAGDPAPAGLSATASPAEPGDSSRSTSHASHKPPAQPSSTAATTARPAQTRAAEAELGLLGTPAGSPPLWRIAEDVEDFYRGTASFAPTPEDADGEPAQAQSEAAPVAAPPVIEPVLEPAVEEESPDGAVVEVDLDAALTATAASAAASGNGDAAAGSPSKGAAPRGSVKAPPPQKAPRHHNKKKSAPPPDDDWICFDPSQSQFKALVRRLDEISGHAAN
jgi:CheY-like chemotaxis protein